MTQVAKSHLLLGYDSVSESPTCTWYSSTAQPHWFMRMTTASSARQFSTLLTQCTPEDKSDWPSYLS